jgi:hypothetical protein
LAADHRRDHGPRRGHLKLKTADGEKLKLMMMRGTGPLGGLGGGEEQQLGVEALGAWFERNPPGHG